MDTYAGWFALVIYHIFYDIFLVTCYHATRHYYAMPPWALIMVITHTETPSVVCLYIYYIIICFALLSLIRLLRSHAA